jgi:hypothetical protein
VTSRKSIPKSGYNTALKVSTAGRYQHGGPRSRGRVAGASTGNGQSDLTDHVRLLWLPHAWGRSGLGSSESIIPVEGFPSQAIPNGASERQRDGSAALFWGAR